MRYALLNPRWTFEGSTYFGCPQTHSPLELLSARQTLRAAGNEVLLIDANIEELTTEDVRRRLDAFDEHFLVIPTAPSYLFWRCPPPELRVPKIWIHELERSSKVVVIGPHGSVTPKTTLQKTGADVVMRGEPDQTLQQLATLPWEMVAGCCWHDADRRFRISDGLGVTDMRSVPMLDYSDYPVERHTHLHHIFPGNGGDHLKLGAEVEFARGCPYSCTFCNKTLFRNKFRERDLHEVLDEIDQLIARGVDYVYFIDEIFGVGKQATVLLQEIAKRPLAIGLQTRMDLWNEDTLKLLGEANCVSFECGIESITEEGREELNKNCKYTTQRIEALLIYARRYIPWVQANLIETTRDDPAEVERFQTTLKSNGVWVSEPVPMFPFPGSPQYVQTFGTQPDEQAWERAHASYLQEFAHRGFSNIQEQHPRPLEELECAC
jgi:anaerobic magnesium-protoporphyrin IX monomethyl ester cyclase